MYMKYSCLVVVSRLFAFIPSWDSAPTLISAPYGSYENAYGLAKWIYKRIITCLYERNEFT